MRVFSILSSCLLALTMTANAWALSAMQPAATVNNEVITVYDLQQRIDLTLIQTQTARNAETRMNIAHAVLETQIIEYLRIIKARELGLSPTERDVSLAIMQFEENNGFSSGGIQQLLQEQGIDYLAFVHSFRAALSWENIVQDHLMQSVDVTDAEVARAVKRSETSLQNANAREVRLMTLVLSHQSRSPEQAQRSAESLRQNVLNGAKFSELARSLSADISAQYGGDLGWISPDSLTPVARAWLETARKGEVSPPLDLGDSTALFLLRDTRKANAGAIDKETIRAQIGNIKLQGKIRAYDRAMRNKAVINILIEL